MPYEKLEVFRSPKRIRVFFGGEKIADSEDVHMLWEERRVPVYYFPPDDVRTDLLEPTDHTVRWASKGEATHWSIETGGRVAENAAWSFADPKPRAAALKDLIAFEWKAMDAWFAEDEPLYVHARNPYHRIDVLRSSRRVEVVVAGETVAETERPVLLFETGLPTRYYIPRLDVRMDLLVPSDAQTECPYKGVASYYSVRVGDVLEEDIVWYYPFPLAEVRKIRDMLCFFNERVDALYVNGELADKPKTSWS
jgi:uncharacterized protein (DUF427 family)